MYLDIFFNNYSINCMFIQYLSCILIINLEHLPFYALINFIYSESKFMRQTVILVKSGKETRAQRSVFTY